MKAVTIIRGVSGTGKSTFGEYIASLDTKFETIICCADDYFNTVEGYKFDVTKLDQAHSWCKGRFDGCIHEGINNIIVNNTSTSEKEFRYYREKAEEHGYMVFVIVMEKWHNSENIHGVPAHTLERQERKLRGSFKPA